MGNCVGGFKQQTRNIIWRRRRNTKSLVIAFLGLDSAGKTTIVKALQGEGTESVHPTMGFSRGEFQLSKAKIVAYDLGGAERIRDIWKIYYPEVYAFVYVVDSAAPSRVEENKRVVDELRAHPDLMYKPILFLLNKKDLPEAVDEMSFSEAFSLHTMACENKTDIRVEGVCAIKGHGKDIDSMIVDGLNWLIDRVLSRYDQLNKEIEAALKQLQDRQALERLQRQHRLATLANQSALEDQAKHVETPVDQAQQNSIPNGVLTHQNNQSSLNDAHVDTSQKHDIAEKETVEAYVEYHPASKNVSPPPLSESPVKATTDERPKNARLRRTSKVMPATDLEGSAADGTIDYKVFENSQKIKRRRSSPLRTKTFDSKALFHPVHRPRLLTETSRNVDVEMTELTQNHLNHISKESSTAEEI